nr:Chain A, Odorant Binding Protein 1 from Varoa destructor, form P3<2>21 [Varroa destructor]7NZA_A Chain A, Odorant Binding Protein from Varroa destructor, form P2<1> [Varroa destructor]7NZA_B Chain B, Odorant Binding Protein from Varroa destructor, form P2<1> [Varroa destructor]
APQAPASATPAKVPVIEWGKCEQLKPSESERTSKAAVVDKCLQSLPLPDPEKATQQEIDKHRESVTTCALKAEGWFDDEGVYKFDRARNEIKNKKLDSEVEEAVLLKHDACQKEATEKHDDYINQVQLYQACMDYNISQICGIKVMV